jgi:transposase
VINHVVEPTSILVTRGARRAKTDRLDAVGLLRVLAAKFAGDPGACRTVVVPSVEEEDAKRPHREREFLVQERVRIENRIAALLATQGVRERPSLGSWDADMRALRTDDGRRLPTHLVAELNRLRRRLSLTLRCFVPDFDGAFLSSDSKDALWDRFYTGAPRRQRRSVERYNIVKRA